MAAILNLNRQMLVLIIAAAVTIIVVYIIRRQKIDHSWKIAIIVGSITQFLILVVGQIALKSDFNIVLIIIGTILGVAAAYICNIVFFALDYKRTEYVQYEDDEYYLVKSKVKQKHAALLTTGAADRNKVMNIYDFAGNVAEWTIGVYSSTHWPCVVRGNSYNSGSNAAYHGDAAWYDYDGNIGFRVSIY